MDATAIDHVYVETEDYEKARAFWTTLGFTPEAEWGEGGYRAGKFVNGGSIVVLAAAAGRERSRPTVHFRVPDTRAAQAELDGTDVRVTLREEATHWGTRWIRIADPDGNEWVLEQSTP